MEIKIFNEIHRFSSLPTVPAGLPESTFAPNRIARRATHTHTHTFVRAREGALASCVSGKLPRALVFQAGCEPHRCGVVCADLPPGGARILNGVRDGDPKSWHVLIPVSSNTLAGRTRARRSRALPRDPAETKAPLTRGTTLSFHPRLRRDLNTRQSHRSAKSRVRRRGTTHAKSAKKGGPPAARRWE